MFISILPFPWSNLTGVVFWKMLRFLRRLQPPAGSQRVVDGDCCGVATTAAGRHANPGNFDNRPRENISEIGHRGGKRSKRSKRGEKARSGGFHSEMDSDQQV
jgi:general stress protein YciG